MLRSLIAFILCAFISSSAFAAAPEEAGKFIEDLGSKHLNVLTDPTQNFAKRSATFRAILKNNFDFAAMAKSALGSYWNDASDAEKKEYVKVLEDYITKIYTIRFSEYTHTDFKVSGTRQEDDRLIVTTMVRSEKNPEPIRIDWRVREDGNSFKIQDVVIEGISMIVSQRSEFNSVIQQNGGTVSGLIKILKDKTATAPVNGAKK